MIKLISNHNKVISKIEHYAKTIPNAPAISDRTTTYTFSALFDRITRLANVLCFHDIGVGDRVIILYEKSVEAWCVALATLKLGATYVPLDVNQSTERISILLTDINPSLVFVNEHWRNELQKVDQSLRLLSLGDFNNTINCSPPEEYFISDDQVAYILYTSGSTGRPKGVQITNRSLYAFLEAVNEYMEIDENARCLSTSPLFFDVSIVDTLLPLYHGAHVHLFQGMILPHTLLNEISNREISHFAAVSPILNLMVNSNISMFKAKQFPHLKRIMTGADVLHVDVINEWLNVNENIKVVNGYGPTEVTCVCIAELIDQHHKQIDSFPIGRPLNNITTLIVDEQFKVCGSNIAGELLISGDQVMCGYYQRPEETKKQLVQIEDKTYYRTGDLCKKDECGLIYFLGRMDDEVKISGYRIHLNEVKEGLLKCQHVKDVFVNTVKNSSNGMAIAAAIVYESEQLQEKQKLRKELKKFIPSYMVPKYLQFICELPKLPTNKINRKQIQEEMNELIKNNILRD